VPDEGHCFQTSFFLLMLIKGCLTYLRIAKPFQTSFYHKPKCTISVSHHSSFHKLVLPVDFLQQPNLDCSERLRRVYKVNSVKEPPVFGHDEIFGHMDMLIRQVQALHNCLTIKLYKRGVLDVHMPKKQFLTVHQYSIERKDKETLKQPFFLGFIPQIDCVR
jgi:hypothetical protein